MKLIIATAATAILAASPAFAADDSGFYVGAGLGNFAADSQSIANGRDFDGSDFGFKVFGGYKFMPYLAVEGEYIDGGEPDDNYDSGTDQLSISIGMSGFVGSAVGILPIGENFDVFAKLGFIYWDADGSLKLRTKAIWSRRPRSAKTAPISRGPSAGPGTSRITWASAPSTRASRFPSSTRSISLPRASSGASDRPPGL